MRDPFKKLKFFIILFSSKNIVIVRNYVDISRPIA